MRGEVLHYADASGSAEAGGVIAGEDGLRYAFGPADLKALRVVRQGMKVDFVPDDARDGRRATEIYFLDAAAPISPASADLQASMLRGAESVRSWFAPADGGGSASPRGDAADRAADWGSLDQHHHAQAAAPSAGPVELIRSCLRSYADGSGRAGRRQFVVFVLFAVLAPVAAFLLDLAWNNLLLGPERLSQGYILPLLAVVTAIGLVPPLLAVASRRLHDVGLSGWLVLLLIVLLFLEPLGLIAMVALAVTPSMRNAAASRYGLPGSARSEAPSGPEVAAALPSEAVQGKVRTGSP